jgi:hypothetical protein
VSLVTIVIITMITSDLGDPPELSPQSPVTLVTVRDWLTKRLAAGSSRVPAAAPGRRYGHSVTHLNDLVVASSRGGLKRVAIVATLYIYIGALLEKRLDNNIKPF